MTQLKKSISFVQGVGLISTTMLGTGVFVIPQLTVDQAGTAALWAWGLVILAVIPLAWVFAQLGRRFPHAGGVAHIVELGFGKQQGVTVGLMFLLLVPVGAPAAIEIALTFLQALIPLSEYTKPFVAFSLIVGIFFINQRGLQLSGSFQAVLTLSIIVLLVALVFNHILTLLGIMPSTAEIKPMTNVASLAFDKNVLAMIASAAGLALWSFLGIEAMNHLSEEFKNPQRDFAPAVLVGVMLVGVLYMACTWLLWQHSSTSPQSHEHLRMIDVFDANFSTGGKWIIGILGFMSSIATVNVYIVSISRLAYSLAQNGALPQYFVHLNAAQVPERALLSLCCAVASILLITQTFSIHYESLIRWTNGVCVLIYLLSILASWKLLASKQRPMIVLAVFSCVFFAVSLGSYMLYGICLWLGALFCIYSKSYISQKIVNSRH